MENLNQDNLLTNQTALETNQTESVSKFMILDTAYFIRMKPLEHNNGFKYYTTDFIVREIRDEKAREFYELNKSFIQTKNPSRDVMRIITTFSKLSNDLKSLSIADLSIIALGYELCKEIGFESLLRKEPLKYEVVETVKAKEKVKEEKLVEVSDDGFVEVKSKGKKKLEKEMKKLWDENDEGEWITKDNIDSKLNKFKIEEGIKEEKESPINVIISTADFTIQNVSLKLGIPVLGVDGMKIRKIKNYILKCCTCNNFIFDTTKLFCEDCGYNLLMKLACSINSEGILKIYDKKVEARNRGTQYDLPKPSLDKKGVIYILSEDQLPKKRIEYNLDRDLEKILDNYECYRDFNPYKIEDKYKQNTSKNFVWGQPKKNPNVAKKYYAKKQKK